MKRIIATVLLSMAAAAPAFAAPAFTQTTPYYVGAYVGDGFVGVSGGYQIDKMFSVEAYYSSLNVSSGDGSSIGVSGVALFPLNIQKVPQLSAFAKVGVEHTTIKTSVTFMGTTVSANATQNDLVVGGGAQYDFDKHLSARAGVNLTGKSNSVYVSGIYRF
jgi:opacity protein-like surface antigen